MEQQQICLTVFFEEPFWIGVFEETSGDGLRACRVVFGAEPKDAAVLEQIQTNWENLRFSAAVEATPVKTPKNPKRRRRQAARELSFRGTGTKSQQALQLAREAAANDRREESRLAREVRKKEQLLLKRAKRKEKHRGH